MLLMGLLPRWRLLGTYEQLARILTSYGPEFTSSRIFRLRLERAVLILGAGVWTLLTGRIN